MARKSDKGRSMQSLKSRYELLLAAIPDILMEVNTDKVYTWANEAGYNFFGDDVIGRPADYFFEGEQDTYERVQPLFEGSEDIVFIDSWQRRRDGEKRLLSWVCRPRLDEDGNIVGSLSSARDITDYQRALDQLAERNRELNIITLSSLDVIFVMTGEGKLNFVSPASRVIFGYEPKEMEGRSFEEYIAEEELPKCWKAVEEIFLHGHINNLETVGVDRHGRRIPIEINGVIITTEEGNVIQGSLRDITERRKAEEEVRNIARFPAESPDPVLRIAKDGTVLYANRVAERVLFEGRSARGEPAPKELRKLAESALASGIIRSGFEIRRRDSVYSWNIVPVVESDHVNVYGMDISKLKMAEEGLRQSNRIINSSPIVAFLWKNEEDWPVEFVTENVGDLFGYTSQDFMDGKVRYSQVVHPDDLQRVEKEVSRFSSDKEIKRFEHESYRIVTKDGETKWVDDKTYIRRDSNGGIIRYEGIVYDITRLKDTEEELKKHQDHLQELVDQKTEALNEKVIKLDRSQRAMLYMVEDLNATRDSLKRSRDELELRVKERTAELEQAYKELDEAHRKFVKSQAQLIQSEKMKAVGGLVAGVAHELNNPMMGILNYVQYCRKHTPNQDKKHAVLADAETEIKRCVDIVDSLLTFSHMEKEGLEEPREIEFFTALERALTFVAHRVKKEHIVIDKKYAPDIPKVRLRVNRIQQVLLNLLNNALDAVGESEKKEITVGAGYEKGYLVISIADTGPGISPEVFDHIFEPFFTTKSAGEGTGLGLSLTKSLVEEEGGTIHCSSKVGRGTKFTIKLPIDAKEV